MRKKDETMRETLLDLARQAAWEHGPDGINIRSLAKQAGVATGTVYNYFENKDDLLLALTEEYWQNTLLDMQREINTGSFAMQLREIYKFLMGRIASSGGILMASLGRVEAAGRQRMQSMQQVLQKELLSRMLEDQDIRAGIWNQQLSQEAFANFITVHLVAMMRSHGRSIDAFIEIVERILYE